MYTEEQKSRIKQIVKHLWCLTTELYPSEIKKLDLYSQMKMMENIDCDLFKEIDKIYIGSSELFALDKCLDILGLLDHYNSIGRPNFSAFREWFYFQTISLDAGGNQV